MILSMMRVKNEARWLRQVLASQLPVADRIFVMDDNSTDETPDICRSIPQVTYLRSPFIDSDKREDRDKNWLLEHVEKAAAPDTWILSCDGDEEIAAGGCDEIRKLAVPGPVDAYRFQVLYLWNSPQTVRMDGIYGRFKRSSLFRLRRGHRFKSACAGGFHCGNVPIPTYLKDSTVKLLHYGYMHKEDRIRKWDWYNAIDPENWAEGWRKEFPERRSYPHMVQGDVPEVPAGEELIHAGPLQIRPLSTII